MAPEDTKSRFPRTRIRFHELFVGFRSYPGGKLMIVWRWLGMAVCLFSSMLLVGGNFSATAQDKDKKADTKKDDTKKETKKDEAKKDEGKKDETKKPELPKDEPGKTRFVWKAFEPKSEWYQELT